MLQGKNITLFGIPNCDTVKKARVWLESQNHAFVFHNFKKDGLSGPTVEQWLTKLDLATLINRKGTTWRALSEEQKLMADKRESAIELMIALPSLIKRPVLQIKEEHASLFNVGFSAAQYESIFTQFSKDL